jgi:hypothetical protein
VPMSGPKNRVIQLLLTRPPIPSSSWRRIVNQQEVQLAPTGQSADEAARVVFREASQAQEMDLTYRFDLRCRRSNCRLGGVPSRGAISEQQAVSLMWIDGNVDSVAPERNGSLSSP